MKASEDETGRPTSGESARLNAEHAKDPTAAARARRYRARKRKAGRSPSLRKRDGRSVTVMLLPPVADRDAPVTALGTPTVTQNVMPTVTQAVTVTNPKTSSGQTLKNHATLPSVRLESLHRDAEPETVRVTLMPPDPVTRQRVAPVLAIVLAALAIVIATVGVAINGWFAGSLGRTPEAAWLFIAIGICADGLALFLPTTASRLAFARQ